MNCNHEEVCVYFRNSACNQEICKFVDLPVAPQERVIRKKSGRFGDIPMGKQKPGPGRKRAVYNFSTSDEDTVKVRKILKLRRKNRMLTEEQEKAIDTYKGTHAKNLNESQRQQMLDILRDSSEK